MINRSSQVMGWPQCKDCFIELRAIENNLKVAMEAKEQNLPHTCTSTLKLEVGRLQNQIALGNQGIIKFLVKKIRGQVDCEELLSVGNESLFDAIRGFDPGRGFQFSTYAYVAIKRRMIQAASKERSERKRPFVIARRAILFQGSNKEFYNTDMFDKLNRVFLSLKDERERRILSCRYGLDKKELLTRRELGQVLGITQEAVRQIEIRALNKLRKCFAQELSS